MMRYEAYKHSGVDWIGDIPEGWEVVRFKRLFKEKRKTTDTSLNSGSISFGEVVYKDDEKITEATKLSYQVLNEGEFLLNPLNMNYDLKSLRIGLSTINVVVSSGYIILQSKKGLNKNYYRWLLRMYDIVFMKTLGAGVRQTINYNDLADSRLIVPSFDEQQTIAQFLDDKTAKIDQTIGIRQKEIELLKERRQILIQQAVTGKWSMVNGQWLKTQTEKLKPSGVDWIGEIPEHWEVRKLKSYCTAFGRIGFRGYTTADLVDEGDGAITISPSNIKEMNMEFNSNSYLSWFKYNESPEIKIRENDILIVKTGSTYGKIGIVKNLPQKATINPQLLVLKKIQIKADYLYELLKSEIFQLQVERNVIGSTIPTISETKILGFSVPIPSSEEEINEISDYILNINEKIAKAIMLKEQEIEKLKEYKTVLIDNVVTGKIKVS